MELEFKLKNLLKDCIITCKSVNLYDPNFTGKATKLYTIRYDDHVFKVQVFSGAIIINIDLKASVLFAVNRPEKICYMNHLITKVENVKVYVDPNNTNNVIEGINLIKAEIIDLMLQPNESLFLYKNGIVLAKNDLSNIVSDLSHLINIKNVIEANFGRVPVIEFDETKIPLQLRDLIPLIKEWSISDDLSRELKISSVKKGDLDKLKNAVMPKMKIINDYLDKINHKEMPIEAIMISNIAELVAEIS